MEFWGFGGFDFQGFVGVWIMIGVGSVFVNVESIEIDQVNGIVIFQCFCNGSDGGIQCVVGGSFGNFSGSSDMVDKVGFVYFGFLVRMKL